jgi:hypothetical protein
VHSVVLFAGERHTVASLTWSFLEKKIRSFFLPSFTPKNQDEEYITCVTLMLDGGCGVMLL